MATHWAFQSTHVCTQRHRGTDPPLKGCRVIAQPFFNRWQHHSEPTLSQTINSASQPNAPVHITEFPGWQIMCCVWTTKELPSQWSRPLGRKSEQATTLAAGSAIDRPTCCMQHIPTLPPKLPSLGLAPWPGIWACFQSLSSQPVSWGRWQDQNQDLR